MANPWKLLQGLLPKDVLQVGTVLVVNSDGTSLVGMVGGGQIQVSGDGFPVTTPVFVKGGQIHSEAPSLNIQTIEV